MERNARQTKCEAAVSDFIQKYAEYPDSYEPVKFSGYTEMYGEKKGKKIPNSEDYIIFHSHKLKNLDCKIETFSGYFYVTYDYWVDLITVDKSNTINTWPPEVKVWTSIFGRTLNAEDSLEISERTKKIKNSSLYNLNEDIKNGNIEKLNEKDMKLLEHILDTVK